MTAEHFILGDTVRSVDGRYRGRVIDRDSYGWPIVDARMFTTDPPKLLYEAPGYWRVVR